MITQILFQLTSAAASIGRVNTASYTVSRQFNAIALGAVAADFTEKFLHTGRPNDLVGLTLFTVLTGRTLLILGFSRIEGNTFRRRIACAVAFFVCTVTSITGQLYFGHGIGPMTVVPLAGIGLGCLGEASNDMTTRRRCVLGMGCVMAAFGLTTEAWGLVFKNLVSDVGATAYSMSKYRDWPLSGVRHLAEAKSDRLSGAENNDRSVVATSGQDRVGVSVGSSVG
jgi:hypothetical protein